ncbi:hypothetical protein BKA60DRAFT_585641 [Fusarium oxysporum]|nr:hypothetical protein BKA60DRAFT_585641 [Fusarium oxysporum]
MMPILYLCGDQAARSLELLTLRHKNTANGGIRTICQLRLAIPLTGNRLDRMRHLCR